MPYTISIISDCGVNSNQMALEIPAFKKVQYEFTAHLRDPETVSAPSDIEDRRMEIYRGLLYRNIENFISSAFPVLHRLYTDDNWHKLVKHFFAHHRSRSPYFRDIPREFLDYLHNERESQPEDPVFINELAYYEWIEAYLAYAEFDENMSNIDPEGDLMQNVPVLSPLTELRGYNFPVHKIKPGFEPRQASKQPVFLMVYRNSQDKIGFMELNPLTVTLIEHIGSNHTKTGKQLLKEIAELLKFPDSEAVYSSGEQALKQLRAKDILLGTLLLDSTET